MPPTYVFVSALEWCDLCTAEDGRQVPARYDAATKMGPWAYLCETHFRYFGIGLGTGVGQRLILRSSEEGKAMLQSGPENVANKGVSERSGEMK